MRRRGNGLPGGSELSEELNVWPFDAKLRADCLAVFDSNVPLDFRPFERRQFEEFLHELPGPYLVLRAAAGRVVGCGGYAVDEMGIASLCWGMVSADRQKLGYGRRLLVERLARIVDEPRCAAIRLETSQRALGFFLKMGFSLEHRVPDGIADGLDKCEMLLNLTDSVRQRFGPRSRGNRLSIGAVAVDELPTDPTGA